VGAVSPRHGYTDTVWIQWLVEIYGVDGGVGVMRKDKSRVGDGHTLPIISCPMRAMNIH